jgi:hypothetical protein
MSTNTPKRERRELLQTVAAAEALFGSRPWEAPAHWSETLQMYEDSVREIEAALERRQSDRTAVEELLQSL